MSEYAGGIKQRIVYVSELSNDGEDFASGEDDNSYICCMPYGNCSCNSLDYALANLASNVLINITSNVTLSSPIIVSYIENVTIIGHNNPTVNCERVGVLHFTNSLNCIIEGITWHGCGIENSQPAIKVSNSSNMSIKNCIVQYSRGQAVLLSDVSGDVNISHCNFVHNNRHRAHGAAILYSSSEYHHFSAVFTINYCIFAYNSDARSLVYIEKICTHNNSDITFYNTEFHDNRAAISVYVVNQKIYMNGQYLFQNNVAWGIFASRDHSTVIFSKNSNITFQNNSAQEVFSSCDHSTVIFGQNSNVTFAQNTVTFIVFLYHSKLTVDQNSVVTFNNNRVSSIYSQVNSNTKFTVTCKVTFSNNFGHTIISNDNSFVTFEGNSIAVFTNNVQNHVIYSIGNSYIYFQGNSTTVFTNNSADGRVIFSADNSYIYFQGNSTTVFTNNAANREVIFSGNNSYIYFGGNSTTVFTDSSLYHFGVIHSLLISHIHFEGNSTTVFTNNYGYESGAIYSIFDSYIYFKGNSIAVFRNNRGLNGAAISIRENSSIATFWRELFYSV